jgi:hypothetical protein
MAIKKDALEARNFAPLSIKGYDYLLMMSNCNRLLAEAEKG